MDKIYSKAKINLGLNVYKRRQNETKHKIESIFILLDDYQDEIFIQENNKLNITYTNFPSLKDQVIKKTLTFLKDKFGIDINYEIKINKNIPLSSGLGGSSTNAAAIMKYVLDRNKLSLDDNDSLYIAKNISSDIPFFLSNYKIAFVSEYGNKIEELNVKNIPKFEIIPNTEISNTKLVFDKFDKIYMYNIRNDFSLLINNLNYLYNQKLYNDLEEAAFLLNPKLLKYKCKNTLMTGSGSFFIRLIGE